MLTDLLTDDSTYLSYKPNLKRLCEYGTQILRKVEHNRYYKKNYLTFNLESNLYMKNTHKLTDTPAHPLFDSSSSMLSYQLNG